MTTGLLIIVALGAALCGWALLSVMSNERHRLLTEQETNRSRSAPSTPTSILGTPKGTVRRTPAADRPAPHSPSTAAKGAGKNVR